MTSANGSVLRNALSFDIEDYFQVSNFEQCVSYEDWDRHESRVERNTRIILDLLSEQAVTATFFVLGWVAEKYPGLVAEIAAAGHELGSHSYRHRLIYTLSPEEFRADLRRSIEVIEQAGGQKVLGHRAPSFSITRKSLWAIDIMQEEGLRYDTSVFPVHHPRYGIPDAPRSPYEIRPGFWEFPMAAVKVGRINLPVAGGAYFRLFPYAYTKWGLSRINRGGVPVSMYLHPWEFDPGQPRFKTSLQVRLRHYTHLDKTGPRLRRLCRDFDFTTVSQALGVA